MALVFGPGLGFEPRVLVNNPCPRTWKNKAVIKKTKKYKSIQTKPENNAKCLKERACYSDVTVTDLFPSPLNFGSNRVSMSVAYDCKSLPSIQ